jgi:hypothetical protein
MFDKSGEISVNRKRYNKYDASRKVEGALFGRKKIDRKAGPQKEKYEELAGINELDTNIPSTPLHLELRLENTEKKLKKVNEEKKANKILDINNPQAAQKLQNEEDRLRENIETYRNEYRQLGTSYRIADTLTRAKNAAFAGLAEIKEKLAETPVIKETLSKIPSFKAKQDVKTAKILNDRLKKEFSRPAKPESETIEHLLVRAERLTGTENSTASI